MFMGDTERNLRFLRKVTKTGSYLNTGVYFIKLNDEFGKTYNVRVVRE
jgi:hypothetical protein